MPRYRAAAVAAALLVAGCVGDPTSPGHATKARLSLAPVFQSKAALIVDFNRVRVTLSRSNGTALDTTVDFPPGADSLVLALLVPINGESETLSLALAMINAAGDTVFRGGPTPVTATLGITGTGTGVSVAVRYVGVGSNARSVSITPRTASLFFGDSVQLAASALDSGGQPIPGTPIVWRSLDSLLARVPVDTSGRVVARTTRGLAHVEAMLLTNQADTAQVTVQPVPAAVSLVSGGGQTGTVGSTLAQPLVARVKAADSLGVRNVYVHFAVTAGGGTTSADSVLSDSLGNAQVTWTLGTTAGAQAMQVSVRGITGSASFGATAAAGAATSLAYAVQPTSATAGLAIAPSVAVAAKDAYGNVAGAFTGTVTVGITSGSGKTGAALRGTTTVAAVAGVATFAGINVDSAGTGYTLTASATGLAAATSAVFAIVPGVAAALTFTAEPPASVTALAPFAVTVTAKDALGNVATGFNGQVAIAIAANPAGGSLFGTLTLGATAGVAAFSGVSIDNIGAGYTVSASATGVTAGTSTAIAIVPPAGWNAWINTAGGNWSVAANWSKGTVPVATDSVAIRQSGTYTVSFNTSTGTFAKLGVGAPLGAQTLSVDTTTLTVGALGASFGPTGVLALSGTGTITGAGAIGVSGAFNWTGGNLGAIGGGAGSVQVLAGGTASIAPATQTQLQNYSLIVAGTGTWTGTAITNTGNGGILRVAAGGVLNVTGAPTISRNLGGSAVLHNLGTINRTTSAGAFVVNDSVSGNGAWNVQTGSMNLQLPGTISGPVSVASGAALNFILGNFSMTFDATSSVTGAGNVVVSSGSTVGFGGRYNVTGTTQLSAAITNFTGAADTIGALLLSGGTLGSTGALTVSGLTTWSAGSFNVNGAGNRVRLFGGSSGSFGGTANLAAGDTLDLAGGTFTLTGNLSVTGGALLVSGGTLVLNGFAGSLAGSFGTSGGGALQMTSAGDSLQITGNATFGGGLGTMNAGVIRLGGNFIQTGTGNFKGLAQSAAVAHRVVLNGASGTQTISFADPVTSFFRRLWIAKGAGSGVTILTDVRTTFFSQTTGTTGFTGTAGPPMTRLIADTIAGIGGGSNLTSPLVIELGGVSSTAGVFTDSGTVNVDTVVFAGAGQSIPASTGPGTLSYKSIRVAQSSGTATFTQTLSLTNDLVVSSGTLSTGGLHIGVGGSFRTEGTGALQMALTNDSLGVGGNVTFGGGSTTGLLSAGIVSVKGSFAQSGNAAAYAPSGTHRTRFDLPGSAVVQNISFVSPTTSFFDSLDLNRGVSTRGTVNFQTDARIVRGLSVENSTDVTGATARITIAGGTLTAVLSTTSPTVKALALELSTAPSIGTSPVSVSPDTMVLNGTVTALPSGTGIVYKSLRVNTSGTLSAPGSNVTFNGSVVVSSGIFAFTAAVDSIAGFLRTEGTGALSMTAVSASPTLIVRDSAVFGGGTSTSLTGGLLRIGGSFVQRTTATAFQASSGHTTVFDGSGTQTVSFANPGSAASRFGNLAIERSVSGISQSAGISLGSNVTVAGTLQDTTGNGAVTDSILGNGFTVTANGLGLGPQFVLNNAPLVTNTGLAGLFGNGPTFRSMSPTVTQWTMNNLQGTSNILSSVNFQTAPTTGLYFAAIAGSVSAPVLSVTSVMAASSLTGLYTSSTGLSTATISWNGTSLPKLP